MKLTNRQVTLLGNAIGFAGFPVSLIRNRLSFYDVAVYRHDIDTLTKAGLLENPSKLVYYTSDLGKAAYLDATAVKMTRADESRLYDTMHRQQAEGIDALAQHVNSMTVPPAPKPDALEVFMSLSRSRGDLTDQQIADIGRQAGYDSTTWIIRLHDFIQGQ